MPSTDHGRRDALPIGTVLRDFTIQAVIGHGGFGIVYRAGHTELDLTVAIKEYLPVELAVREGTTVQPRSGTERKDFEEGLRRFRDEAQALIDFDSHPSIVSCREFFRAHGTAYLVMAYEDGESLAEVLARREAEGRLFAAADLLRVMEPVLEGLERVHAAGVLHRDIKPSNILIRRRDGRPVLIDFGAAKQATARFSKSQAPYTEGYAALEQVADAGKLGPWTDMYGVGAVMWRMVAGGNRPWEPPHPVRVEQRSHAAVGGTEDPLPSASELGKGRFPSELLEVIDLCLRLRETERVQGSRELLEALHEVSELPPADGAEVARPLDERSGARRWESGARAVPASALSRTGWRRGGWIALAGLAVGLGLVVSTWWSSAGESWMNALGMEFVWIPAGTFLMGSPMNEEGRDLDERQHEVRISDGFWMGKYEVTQGEWEAVMGTNPSYFSGCGPQCPVESVSWEDTQEFVRRLNSREFERGYVYRLPTEAEWEYAVRAGSDEATPEGAMRMLGASNAPVLDGQAWYRGNSGVAYAGGARLLGIGAAAVRCGNVRYASGGPEARKRVGHARHAGKRVGVDGGLVRRVSIRYGDGSRGSQDGLAPGGSGRLLGQLREARSVGVSQHPLARPPQPRHRLPLGQDRVTLGAITLSPSGARSARRACVGQRRPERKRPSRAAECTPGLGLSTDRASGSAAVGVSEGGSANLLFPSVGDRRFERS